MLKIISLLAGISLSLLTTAQINSEKPKILYGSCNKDSLMTAPFDKWFGTGYDNYKPDAATINQLKKQNLKDISVKVFFGTWCGDSRREVPHFMKLLNEISFPVSGTNLVAVGSSDSLYKQSPDHQEKGLGIFKVPAIIIYRKGVEINRITEYPAMSLEKDFLNIVSNDPVQTNYHSFAVVNKWLNDGTLLDDNISSRSLATQLKQLVANENELNSLGYVLLAQDKKKEALKIFQVNNNLYPESSNVISSLGEGYFKTGDNKNAVTFLEKALEQNKDPQAVKGILEILYKAKGIK
ncbi:MAG: hypothetical protein ABJA78_05485 [Ferruginibacter sp.]